MRAGRMALVFAMGCGRIGFSDSPADDVVPPGDDARVDAPNLPSSRICAAKRIPIPPVAADADLATATDGANIIVMWTSPGDPVSAALIATIATNGTVIEPPITLPTGPVRAIAGLVPMPNTKVAFTTASQDAVQLWYGGTDSIQKLRSEPGRVIAHDPIVSNSSKTSRAFVRGDDSGMQFTYLDASGALGADRPFATQPIVSIAAADNSDHTHITWEENKAGISECYQADLDLVPGAPDIPGSAPVASDCHEPRIDSGPAASDVIFNLWRSGTRTIEARYHGGIDDVSKRLSTRGRAPRIRYDTARFWGAWIEESSGRDVLRVAQIEVPSLAFATVDLAGWAVAGDEAFELVRVDNIVYLVLLSTDAITIMKTCANG